MMNGKKTYLVALGAILGAAGGYFTGAMTADQAIQLAVTGLVGATLRNGIANNQNPPSAQ